MRLPNFDFKNPPIGEVFRARAEALQRIRAEVRREKDAGLPPLVIPRLKAWYKDNPWDFVDDWGCTFDPRLVERGLPSLAPFVLFDKQREYMEWVHRHWLNGRPGLAEKSRDCGLSWVSVAWACSMCLHWDGFSAGFGSRKEEYVDKVGHPKSLFWKAREFMKLLPIEFRGGWQAWRDAPHMRISFPQTGSVITGEAGDQIGRGDRQSIYFVDEAAFLERPQLVDAALSNTTNCRIDISSVNGMGNPFAQKRHAGKIDVFVFDWRDDPRKDQAWYERQVNDHDPTVVAQEIDRDYTASVEGIVIPGAWIRSALDAHLRLGIKPSGERGISLDIADEGKDKNAVCGAHGVVVDLFREWSGKGSDIFATTEWAFQIADEGGYKSLRYDADGLGAGVRGDARIINERRVEKGWPRLTVDGFRGSAGVHQPDSEDVKGRQNKDYFANLKAQAWWSLRVRFQRTHRWITQGIPCDPDQIISISSSAGDWARLVTELSQPTYQTNHAGKIVIDKTPDGVKSPNMADSVMMRFAPGARVLPVSGDVLRRAGLPRNLAAARAAMGAGRRRGP